MGDVGNFLIHVNLKLPETDVMFHIQGRRIPVHQNIFKIVEIYKPGKFSCFGKLLTLYLANFYFSRDFDFTLLLLQCGHFG